MQTVLLLAAASTSLLPAPLPPLAWTHHDALTGGDAAPQALSLRDAEPRLYFTEHENGLWVRGTTYKARFHPGGFTYIPFLGSEAPRNYPVDFSLRSATLAGRQLTLAATAEVTASAERVVLDRGPVDVIYDLAHGSVEQSFALDAAGATGDLILELDVRSDLAPMDEGGGLRFHGPEGGVTYSAAIVFDSVGQRADVPMEFDGSSLALTVPASFLARAVGPVVIDPVVATYLLDDYTSIQDGIDVAFDASFGQNTYVYEDYFSQADVDVYSRSIDTFTNQVVSASYVDMTADSWITPKIASMDANNTALIVANKISATTGVSSIVGRIYSQAAALPGPEITLATPPAGRRYANPDVGGDNDLSATDPKYLIAWEETNLLSHPGQLWTMLVGPTGTPGVPRLLVGNGSVVGWGVAVSKANSTKFGFDLWSLTYGSRDSQGGPYRISGALVDGTGQIPVNVVLHASPTVRPYDFDITQLIIAGSTTPKGLISYTDFSALGTSEKRLIQWDGSQARRVFDLNELEHGPTGRFVHGIRVASTWAPGDAPEFVVAYREEEPGGAMGVYVTTLDAHFSTGLAISEHRTRVGTSNEFAAQHGSLELASRASGGYHSKFSLLAWTRFNSLSNSEDAYGATHYAGNEFAIGQQYCLGVPNSTGNRGFLAAYGDSSTTSNKTLRASSLPAHSVGFFIAGMGSTSIAQPGGSLGVLCLGGAGVGRYSDLAASSGAAGVISLSLDPTAISTATGTTAATSGQSWNFQLWHRDQVSGSAVSNFTNAVTIVFL